MAKHPLLLPAINTLNHRTHLHNPSLLLPLLSDESQILTGVEQHRQHQHPHPLRNSTHRTPHVLATPPRCTLTHPYLAIALRPLVGQRMLISRNRKPGHTTPSTLHHTT